MILSQQQQAVSRHIRKAFDNSKKDVRRAEDLAPAELCSMFSEDEIVVQGALHYPTGLQPLVDKALEHLATLPNKDDLPAYESGDGGPARAMFELTRLPYSSPANIPPIELIPTEEHLPALHIENDERNVIRIGCSSAGTVFRDASVRSAAMTLALKLIEVYADACAKAAERTTVCDAITSFKHYVAQLDRTEKSHMTKRVTPQLYTALQKLYPERNVFTELQIKSVQDWLHAPSRSEPQLHFPPVVGSQNAPTERKYYVPSTVLSRSGSISKSLEAKLSEVHRKKTRLTDAIAFQFRSPNIDSTEPADLNLPERAQFYEKLLTANKMLQGIAEAHDDLFDQDRILDRRKLDETEILTRHAWIQMDGGPARERSQILLNEVSEMFRDDAKRRRTPEPRTGSTTDFEPPPKRRSMSNDEAATDRRLPENP